MSDLQSEIENLDRFLNDPWKAYKDSGRYGLGATTGAAVGGILLGPVGALVGAGIGVLGAYSTSPKVYSYVGHGCTTNNRNKIRAAFGVQIKSYCVNFMRRLRSRTPIVPLMKISINPTQNYQNNHPIN